MAKPTVVSSASAAGTSVAIGTHQADDLLIVYVYRGASTALPTVPTAGGTVPTWTFIDSGALNSSCHALYYAVATANNHTTGTWTNATGIACIVVRGHGNGLEGFPFLGNSSPLSCGTPATSGAPVAPSVWLSDASGESLILRFYFAREVSAWDSAPSGYTRETSFTSTSGACVNSQDSTTTSASQSQTGTIPGSQARSGATLEILGQPDPATESPQFDNATLATRTGTEDPFTFSHTPVGTPKGVVVMCATHAAVSTDEIAAVTYGGVALTEIVQAIDNVSENVQIQMWFLGEGIPTGTQTVSIDMTSGTTTDWRFECLTLTADGDLEVVDFDELNQGFTNPSLTVQTNGRVCLAFGMLATGHNAPSAHTPVSENNIAFRRDSVAAAQVREYMRQAHASTSDFTISYSMAAEDGAMVLMNVAKVSSGFVPRAIFL